MVKVFKLLVSLKLPIGLGSIAGIFTAKAYPSDQLHPLSRQQFV